jgi:hypothetical protein
LELDTASFNKLNLFKFHVDFTNPSKSTFSGPIQLTVAAYQFACDGGICIPQPSPGEALDALSDGLMYRLPYRNFGNHESLVANHAIAPTKGDAFSAVRWYEIRNPSSAPNLYQSGTFSLFHSGSVWMASIAMDKAGDIALGFSASSPDLDPSILYTGRVPSDPLGTMESPTVVKKGTGVQEVSFNRWGDYSSMAIDPSDDCTFWYAQEYYKTTGSFNFSTRLNSFTFTRCH